jgi:hypothetical protein
VLVGDSNVTARLLRYLGCRQGDGFNKSTLAKLEFIVPLLCILYKPWGFRHRPTLRSFKHSKYQFVSRATKRDFFLFCAVTNKCKINSQNITSLHVLTLSCHFREFVIKSQVFQMQLLVFEFDILRWIMGCWKIGRERRQFLDALRKVEVGGCLVPLSGGMIEFMATRSVYICMGK